MPTPPLTKDAIKALWQNQNPALVQALESGHQLTDRLAEANTTANLVMGHAISRGLSPEQARELAQDAVGLELAQDLDDE